MENLYAATTSIRELAEPKSGKNVFEITEIGVILKNAVNAGLVIGSLLTLAFLLWGALEWIMSGGDKTKYEAARNKITHALIGLTIMAFVWLIWLMTLYFLGLGGVEPGTDVVQFGSPEP